MRLDLRGYDFVDFGASSGGSTDFARRHLAGGRALAIDRDSEKVTALQGKGIDVVECDAATITETEGKVRFSILSHFLEHLPSVAVALRCLESARRISNDFVYVQQPWFDADAYLTEVGLKLFWSDWRGHSNHMRAAQFSEHLRPLAADGRIAGYTMWGHGRILNSEDPALHTRESAGEQHEWTDGVHPPKPSVQFDRPVFRELRCFIRLSSTSAVLDAQDKILQRSGSEPDVLDRARSQDAVLPELRWLAERYRRARKDSVEYKRLAVAWQAELAESGEFLIAEVERLGAELQQLKGA